MSQLYLFMDTTHKVKTHDDEIRLIDASMRVGLYASIIAILVLIIALIVKLMWKLDDEGTTTESDSRATETSLLLSEGNPVFIFYGTGEEDLESGKGSCNSSSSSQDLDDEKICAICYDDQRCCSFVPCGHCVTCFTCAKRLNLLPFL